MHKPLFTAHSKWIWLPEVPQENSYGEFRTVFSVLEQENISLHISTEGRYAAWMNGHLIPSGQYDDYPVFKAVQTPDLTQLVRAGQNELLIQVWYPGRDTSVTRLEKPGLRFEIWQGDTLLTYSDGNCQARRLAGYQWKDVPDLTPQLGSSFLYRPTEPAPWRQAGVVEKEAELAARPIRELVIGEAETVRIQSQGFFRCSGGKDPGQVQQLAGLFYRNMDELSQEPVNYLPCEKGIHFCTQQGDGIFLLLDLGKTTSGFLVLDVVTPAAAVVDVAFGEHLEDLRIRSSVGGRCFAVSCGAGPERKRFIHPFRRLAGRYLQIFLYTREAVVYEAGLLPVTYPVNERLIFTCADHLHEAIYKTSKATLHACMHEHYEDCPWREQALYAFDSRNQMLAGYYAFGEFDYARENLRLLAFSQRKDGLLELCAPARVPVNIPSFSLAFVKALEEYCVYSGDTDFGREILPIAERIVENVLSHVREGVAWNYCQPGLWNFYEWSEGLDGMPMGPEITPPPSADAGLQLFTIMALQSMERLAEMTGERAEPWERARRELQDGLKHFWNEEHRAYAAYLRGGSQEHYAELIQALALYTGSCPADRARDLRGGLLEHRWIPVTLSYSIFRYEALLQEPKRYAKAVFHEVAQRWGRMLFQGAATFWETDKGLRDFDGAGSLCHGWSGIPIYLYGAYVLGIRPEQPGVWRQQPVIDTGICGAGGTLLSPEGFVEIGSVDHSGL